MMVWTSESSWQCKEEVEKDDYKLELRVQLLTDYGTRFNSFPVLVSNCLIDLFSHLPERKSSMSQVPWKGGRCRTETNLNTLQM